MKGEWLYMSSTGGVLVVVYGEYSHDDDNLITLPEPTTSSVESHVF